MIPRAPTPQTKQSAALQWLKQGATLHLQGKWTEAENIYNAILKTQPGNLNAEHLLGVLRLDQGRHQEALTRLTQVRDANPGLAAVHADLGKVLTHLGHLQEALDCYDKALAIQPDQVAVLNKRGILLRDLKRPEEAIASYDAALELKPDYAEALNNRGFPLRDLKRYDEELASYDRALALDPDYADALNNRGIALHVLGRLEEAVASFDRALAIQPDNAEALFTRANVLRELDDLDAALASYDSAIALKPDFAGAHSNRALTLHALNRPDEALIAHDRVLALTPDDLKGRYNHALVLLALGRLGDGWSGYETRFGEHGLFKRRLTLVFPLWSGEDLTAKRIIVYDEQGMGDVIQFARYLALLVSAGADVTFYVRPALNRLLTSLAAPVRLVDLPADKPMDVPDDVAYDFQCALLSLPAGFRTTLETIPATIPYLAADPPLVDQWRQRIGRDGLKIGIVWQGNPEGTIDAGRSIPLRCFAPLAHVPGVRLISLQKTHGLDQLNTLPATMTVETLGPDFDNGPDAFVDTAAVMASLDLIITSDTSIAHLAGALGRTVWLALKHVPEWRWMLERADSPWYPTMRLYRQTSRGDWDGIFERMATDVKTLARPAA